jgi:hypothetical protein
MPTKTPILKKNHIIAIVIIGLLAGLIGASPTIYHRLSGQTGNNASLINILMPDAGIKAGDVYEYIFPVVYSDPVYYFPVIKRGYDAFVQEGSPVHLPNFNHPDMGCSWTGIAGQVFRPDGNPVQGYTLIVSGSINGTPVSFTAVTGGAQGYGVGGYEIQLAGAPFSSSGLLMAYLYDTNLRLVAAPFALTTYQDCQGNLILLNFITE